MAESYQNDAPEQQRLLSEIDRAQSLVSSLPNDIEQHTRLATMGLMASFFAHECRNRLTPIIGYTKAASRDPKDLTLVRTALSRISDAACDLAQLSDLILGLSSKGPERTSVVDAWTGSCNKLADLIAETDTSISTQIDIDCVTSISRCALKHVFENLVRNAIEAGQERVHITMRVCSTRNNQHTRITITDDAGGLKAGMETKICEPFVSGKGSTGLGLALCRYLVTNAGGTLEFTSMPGVGTTASIMLPTVTDAMVTTPVEELTHLQD